MAIGPNLPGIRLRGRRQRGRRGVLFTVGREGVRGAAVAAYGSKLRRGVGFRGVSPSGFFCCCFIGEVSKKKGLICRFCFFEMGGGEKNHQGWFVSSVGDRIHVMVY